jgi:cytochrome c-type biogenesis protein CcmF
VVDDSNDTRAQVGAEIAVDGKVFAPALQQFPNGTQPIGKPTVRNSPTDSVLVALLDLPEGSGDDVSVRIRVIVQPLIVWLWIGGATMAFGSILSAFPGRRRKPTDPTSALPAVDTQAPGPDPGPDPDGDREPVGAPA